MIAIEKCIIERGDIYYADLPATVGSEQGGTRPVIIVQNNIGNAHSPVVIVIPLTKQIKAAIPTHGILRKKDFPCLKEDSVYMAEQITRIDKTRLKNKIGFVSNKLMENVNNTIKISMAL